MTEILFYHLQRQPIERVLPALLEKSLERGWRVVVQAASEERIEALDSHLWTFRDDAFLPHGVWREPEAREQPILLTVNDDNPNQASVRFLLDGAAVPADAATYQRIRTRSRPRAHAGRRPREPASTSHTGSRTSRGAGSARPDLSR
jgi:DNA polymerase-3 subunit chi